MPALLSCAHFSKEILFKIILWDYTEKTPTEFTVQLTAIDGSNNLHTTDVKNNEFTVFGNPGKFFWFVIGKHYDIDIEANISDYKLKGLGPYTWVEKYN